MKMKKFLATVLTLVIAVSAIPASSVKTDAATDVISKTSDYVPPHVTSCDSGKYKFEKGIECGCEDCKNYIKRYCENESLQSMIKSAAKIDEDKEYSKEWYFYSCPEGLSDDEVIEKFKEGIEEIAGYFFRSETYKLEEDYNHIGYMSKYFFEAAKEKKDILPYIKRNKNYFAEYIRKFGFFQVNEENSWGDQAHAGYVASLWYHAYLANYQNDIEYAGLTNQQKIDRWWKDLADSDSQLGSMFFYEGYYRMKDEKPLENVKAAINDKSLVLNWSYNGPKKCRHTTSGDVTINSDPNYLGFFVTISYDKNFKNAKQYYISLLDNKYVEIYGDLLSGGGFNWVQNKFSYTINDIDTNKDIYYKICLGYNNWESYYDSNDCYREKDCPYFVGTEAEGNQIHWFSDERPKNAYSKYVSTGVIYKDVSEVKKGNNLTLVDKKTGKKIVTLKKPKVKSAKKKSKKSKSLTFKVKNAPKVKGYKTGYQVEVYGYPKTKCSSKDAKRLAKRGEKTKKVGKTYYYYPKKTYSKKQCSANSNKFKKSGKSYKKVTLSSKKFKNKKNLRVRVRYYIKISGHTMYGDWSNVQKVKTK